MSNATTQRVLLASLSRAYDLARNNNAARFTLRVPEGVRMLQVDKYENAYFTRTLTEEVFTSLTLSQLESAYIRYDGRGISLYIEEASVVVGVVA